ncbi:MAG: META domain-containing protein [Sphingomicrobium sp.]
MRRIRLATAAILTAALAGCTSIAATSATFENSRWRVAAINGEATPALPNYRMAFERGRIGGQFGCNHFGGDYRVRGDTLTTGAVAMTEMACSGPADHFEGRGLAVLTQPMRLNWTNDQRLTLANAAGSIALERLP